jgi:hypothetical protein
MSEISAEREREEKGVEENFINFSRAINFPDQEQCINFLLPQCFLHTHTLCVRKNKLQFNIKFYWC